MERQLLIDRGDNISNYRDLEIYKKTKVTFSMIYPSLKNYPKSEKYVLCAEIKLNFINLMKNIMLASKVKSKRKYYQNLADGYLQTCKILITLSCDLEYINENFFHDIDLRLSEIGRMLSGWIKSY